MKAAYTLLDRARKLIKDSDGKITIAKIAQRSGVNDGWLRRLLEPGTKHKTLDYLKKLETTVGEFEVEAAQKIEANKAKTQDG